MNKQKSNLDSSKNIVSGQSYDRWTSHFHPSSPIFDSKQAILVIASDLGLVSVLGLLIYASSVFGTLAVIKYYLLPYLWVNHWLVMITFLQHTDVKVPHYNDSEWDFLKGALATIDRDYGLLNHFFHHIGDTHVAHHLFSTMPHYHAERATAALNSYKLHSALYPPLYATAHMPSLMLSSLPWLYRCLSLI
jgi:omega-6 fatty acid desaturase (delta-12 desaturase)